MKLIQSIQIENNGFNCIVKNKIINTFVLACFAHRFVLATERTRGQRTEERHRQQQGNKQANSNKGKTDRGYEACFQSGYLSSLSVNCYACRILDPSRGIETRAARTAVCVCIALNRLLDKLSQDLTILKPFILGEQEFA